MPNNIQQKFMIAILLLLGLSFQIEAQEESTLGFRPLFNGKDLSGWVDVNTSPETWKVKDGMLICKYRSRSGY